MLLNKDGGATRILSRMIFDLADFFIADLLEQYLVL